MSHFHFKQFSICQSNSAMKVTLDACLFAAYIADQYEHANDILDLGAGTGLLSLMLAQSINAQVTGIELDHDAYQEALNNVKASPFNDRVSILQADIRSWHHSKKFDLIVSNPPFFTDHLVNPDKQKAMARHNDSLPFIDLLQCIKRHMQKDGEAWILLPTSETGHLFSSLTHANFVADKITTVRSKANKPAHRQFIRLKDKQSKKADSHVQRDELCIHDGDGYHARFKALLKPYYLKL